MVLVMKEPSELAKALDVILKDSALEHTNGSHGNRYATPPVVAYGEEGSPEREVHLRDYWRTIRKRLWLIIGLAVMVSSIVAVKQAGLPNVYQARARVQVDTETYSPALGASKGGSYYIDNSYMDPEYFNTQVQILSSPTLLRRVAKTLDLEHNSTFLDSHVENRSTWQNLKLMVGLGEKGKEPAANAHPIPPEGSSPTLTRISFTADTGEIERLAPYVDSLHDMLEVEQVKKTRAD
jgi:uncharacterized protein involved in exopolysaccharide biosynthesis